MIEVHYLVIQYLLCFDNVFGIIENERKKKGEEQILKQKFFKTTYNITKRFPCFRKSFPLHGISTNVP